MKEQQPRIISIRWIVSAGAVALMAIAVLGVSFVGERNAQGVLTRELQTRLIVEDFIITAETLKKSRQTWSLEAIGALRYLVELFGDYPIPVDDGRGLIIPRISMTLQSPSSAKAFATNDKLRNVGWYVPGKGHANDAARHLLVYCAAHGSEIGFALDPLM